LAVLALKTYVLELQIIASESCVIELLIIVFGFSNLKIQNDNIYVLLTYHTIRKCPI